jgi:hypothetical protein
MKFELAASFQGSTPVMLRFMQMYNKCYAKNGNEDAPWNISPEDF